MAKNVDASLIVLSIIPPTTYRDFGYTTVRKIKEIENKEDKQVQDKLDKLKKKAMTKGVSIKNRYGC